MKIVLCMAGPTAARVAAAEALARDAGPDALLVLAAEAAPDGPADPPAAPVVRLADCYGRDGGFQPVRLVARLDAVPPADWSTLVLDHTHGPMAAVDRHGDRAGEVPYYFLKRFFWKGPRPEFVVHCVAPHLVLYYAREWARMLCYPPAESTRSNTHDDAARRIAHIIGETAALRAKYHPWDQAKRKVNARLGRLAFWRR